MAAAWLLVSLPGGLAIAATNDWQTILDDKFHREMLGPDWRIVRGDWRIENGRLRVTRAWSSDSGVLCNVPTPRGDMRVVMTVTLEGGQGKPGTGNSIGPSSIAASLRAGESDWGGGGYPDLFTVFLTASTDEKAGVIHVPADKPCVLDFRIENGVGIALVNGEEKVRKPVPPARSEVNRQFYFSLAPNGWIDGISLHTKPGQELALPLAANTPDENRKATVEAAPLIDPKNPALGMQQAIDSLPANGGVVILPAGEFVMRRHLRLRSGVTLRGQGYDKTILKAGAFHTTKIVKLDPADGSFTATVEDASKFLVGDAVCFDKTWGHPGTLDTAPPNQDMVITAISGNSITVRGKGTGTSLTHFFPLIYALDAEFVEIKDLTLRGDLISPKIAAGSFMTCPVTFGCLYGARVHRVNVATYPADGISLQTGGDAMLTDNTVTGTEKGFHPGTRTQRYLWARNLSVGNTLGLFFCFSNENGVYWRNTLDQFTGYPTVGDIFNTIGGNEVLKELDIESGGYAGVFFNNRLPGIKTSGLKTEPGTPLYFSPGRYYVFGENQLGSLTFGEGTMGVVAAGKAREFSGDTAKNIYSPEDLGIAKRLELPVGVGRDKPVPPPALPEPILDGRKYYQPDSPDCGFQRALDELATKGGTLRLPGGRYPLAKALRLPSKVTLTGQGIGTVLHAADGYTGSLIEAANTTLRDFTILSRYDPQTTRAPAILIAGAEDAQLEGLDIRGWEGEGIRISDSSVKMRDCRVIGATAEAVHAVNSRVHAENNLAKGCRRGFWFEKARKGTFLAGNIINTASEEGILLAGAEEPRIVSDSITFCGGDGILLTNTTGAFVLGIMCRANNQSLRGGAGIRLTGDSQRCQIFYNFCGDDQLHATQAQGLIETATGGNVIQFNLFCPFYMKHEIKPQPAILTQSKSSVVNSNLVVSAVPSGSSLESRELDYFGAENGQVKLRYNVQQQKIALESSLMRLRKQIAEAKDSGKIASNERLLQQKEQELRRVTARLNYLELKSAWRSKKLEIMTLEAGQTGNAAQAELKNLELKLNTAEAEAENALK